MPLQSVRVCPFCGGSNLTAGDNQGNKMCQSCGNTISTIIHYSSRSEDAVTLVNRLQTEIKEWATKNFPLEGEHSLILGMTEELGELAHHVLKRDMGIRGEEGHDAKIRDAIGDLQVFLLQFCTRQGLNPLECLMDVWREVKQRDWLRFPQDGKTH